MNSSNDNLTLWMKIKQWLDPRHLYRSILLLDDTPHSIALGSAIGVFVAFTPTVGVQMIFVLLIALLVRPFFTFNKIAALIAVYISNPLTTLPIYWFNYKIGTYFVSGNVAQEDLTVLLKYNNFSEWWDTVCGLLFRMGWPLVIGSVIVALICAALAYPLILIFTKGYQNTSHRIGEEVSKRLHHEHHETDQQPKVAAQEEGETAEKTSEDETAASVPPQNAAG